MFTSKNSQSPKVPSVSLDGSKGSSPETEDSSPLIDIRSRLMEAIESNQDELDSSKTGHRRKRYCSQKASTAQKRVEIWRNKMRFSFDFLQQRQTRQAIKRQSLPNHAAFWSDAECLELLDNPFEFALAVEHHGFADFLLPIEEDHPEAFAYGPEGFWPELAERLGGTMASWADRERRAFLAVEQAHRQTGAPLHWPTMSAPPDTDWADRAALRALGVTKQGEEDDLRAQCLLSLQQRDHALTILAILVAKGCPLMVLRALWGEETLDMALMEALARGQHDRLGFDGVKTLQLAVRSRVFPAELALPAVVMRKQFERLCAEQQSPHGAASVQAVPAAAKTSLNEESTKDPLSAAAQHEAVRAQNIGQWVRQLCRLPVGMECLGPQQKPQDTQTPPGMERLDPVAQKKLDELAQRTGSLPPSEALERALRTMPEAPPAGPSVDAFRRADPQPHSEIESKARSGDIA